MPVIAVTGATGFVGQATVSALQGAVPNASIRLLIRSPRARRLPRDFDDCEAVAGSLNDVDALASLVDEADCVIHIAAAIAGNCPADFERHNICGTRRVVDAISCNAPETHLIQVSSLAARHPELSWYAASKRAAEEIVVARCRRFSILRPPAVYGPADPALAVFWRLLARGWLIRAGNWNARFSLLHVDDLAEAVCRLVQHGPTGKIMPLAGPEPADGWRWSELAKLAARASNRKIRTVPVPAPVLSASAAISLTTARMVQRPALLSPGKARELLHRNWVCDNQSMSNCLGWTPTTRLEHALGTLPGWKSQ